MPRPQKKKDELAARGAAALNAGDFALAEHVLKKAVALDKRNTELRVGLGFAHQQLGDIDSAAREYCEALAIKPGNAEAGGYLNALVRKYQIEDPSQISKFGLIAALSQQRFDAQPMADLSFAALAKQGELAKALDDVQSGRADDAARDLVGARTAKVLRDKLLLTALQSGKITNIAFEQLFTAVRKVVLCELNAQRMRQDRDLLPVLLALISQCVINEYLWAVTDQERAELSKTEVDVDKLVSGDLDAAWALCLRLLYGPVLKGELIAGIEDRLDGVRPKALAGYLAGYVADRKREQALAGDMTVLSVPADDVGRRVASQYEESPYPRWTSLETSRPGSLRRAMGRFFSESELAFMDAPFDVLVAGCGTGQHAAQAASAYGADASVLGIDISLASLAYGQRMSERHDLKNVAFAQADILQLGALERRFDIIESIGVLHHMDDPFAGWQSLIGLLKPGGLMYLGFYSATARRGISDLHGSADYPGAGCNDDEARAYRQALIANRADPFTEELLQSTDFYSLSDFRDLILHQHEHHLDLARIAAFMSANDLVFHGFTIDDGARMQFADAFPESPWPGSLEDWEHFEQKFPRTFDGMYRFWCRRPG